MDAIMFLELLENEIKETCPEEAELTVVVMSAKEVVTKETVATTTSMEWKKVCPTGAAAASTAS